MTFDVHKENMTILTHYNHHLFYLEKKLHISKQQLSKVHISNQSCAYWCIDFFERLKEHLPVIRFFHYFLQTIFKELAVCSPILFNFVLCSRSILFKNLFHSELCKILHLIAEYALHIFMHKFWVILVYTTLSKLK